MGSVASLEQLYTSAPIADYDEDDPVTRPEQEREFDIVPGVATLAPEAFDAAILEALIAP